MSLSPEQCRAARGMLDLSQAEVAEVAHLTAPTIRGFERHGKTPSYNNLQAIKAALEAAGVIFIPADGGGHGVRFRQVPEAGALGEMVISPDLCRAARYLASLSQQDLAAAAGVARSTVAEFERGARMPVTDNVTAMRKALEAAGITFIAADDIAGPGVRLRK